MMNYILFDGKYRNNLLPFTYTRPVADIRVGILTIREKWEKLLNTKTSTLTKLYLQQKYPLVKAQTNVLINSSFIPTKTLADAVENLKLNQALMYANTIIAVCTAECHEHIDPSNYEIIAFNKPLKQLTRKYQIFTLNEKAIKQDFELLIEGLTSAKIPEYVFAKNPDNIFIHPTAKLSHCSLNADGGYIYIGPDTEIMEGVMIRGSFALCNHSTVKMGAKVYGATTIGPHSKVGGELNNVVIFGYSNKAHDGFLGNSVIGEWCNLGADSNNSNLKNNYAEVKLWCYESNNFVPTGLQFCGLIMGDHSKCGINTMFNTGTVVGVSANVFGNGFPRNFIPSFSWGGSSGFSEYKLDKVKQVAQTVMQRRQKEFCKIEENIIEEVFNLTSKYREHY